MSEIKHDKPDAITRLRAINAELVEALRNMLRLIDEDDADPAPYLIDAVCDRARAAIAKAEKEGRTAALNELIKTDGELL